MQYAPEVFEFDIDGLAYVKDSAGELLQTPGVRTGVPARLHLEVIAARPVRAVLHTHSTWSTLVSDRFAPRGGVAIQGALEKSGVAQAPVTFEEFLAAAEKVKAAGFIPVAHGGQPGHRQAWLDTALNRACGNFFLDTLPTVDEAYLRESILQPSAKVVEGYERGESGMPSYAGVLTDSQIESIVLFIKSLK